MIVLIYINLEECSKKSLWDFVSLFVLDCPTLPLEYVDEETQAWNEC